MPYKITDHNIAGNRYFRKKEVINKLTQVVKLYSLDVEFSSSIIQRQKKVLRITRGLGREAIKLFCQASVSRR